jgi:hypothetical protein
LKLLDVTPLQEPHKVQFGLRFKQRLKEMMKRMGWKKSTPIAVYRHGAGFFITKATMTPEELKLLKTEPDEGESDPIEEEQSP